MWPHNQVRTFHEYCVPCCITHCTSLSQFAVRSDYCNSKGNSVRLAFRRVNIGIVKASKRANIERSVHFTPVRDEKVPLCITPDRE